MANNQIRNCSWLPVMGFRNVAHEALFTRLCQAQPQVQPLA